MKIIELADHELSLNDFSNFELNLQLSEGRITATANKWITGQGMKRVRLTNLQITFDENNSLEGRIESMFRAYGFQRKNAIFAQSGTESLHFSRCRSGLKAPSDK